MSCSFLQVCRAHKKPNISPKQKLSGISNNSIIGPTACQEPQDKFHSKPRESLSQVLIRPANSLTGLRQSLLQISKLAFWLCWLASELCGIHLSLYYVGGVRGRCNQVQLVSLDAGHLNCSPYVCRTCIFVHSVNSSNFQRSHQQNID